MRRLITYKTQPDYPKPEEKIEQASTYLAYIDLWQRDITTIEDSSIREVALNIPDTTTRTKTIWQLKLKKFDTLAKEVKETVELPEDLNSPKWKDLIDRVWGKFQRDRQTLQVYMNACAKLCSSSGNEASGMGYQRLENLLYRVEIYNPSQNNNEANTKNSTDSKATFKWSRDNGSVVSAIEKIEGNIITIRKSNQDAWMSSRTGQWLEITNDEMELKGKLGVMVLLKRAFDAKIEFDDLQIVNGPIPNDFTTTKVRLWNHEVKNAPQGAIPITDDWIELETGIKVKFDKNSVYETGDYWLIPARSATNDIEWPNDQADKKIRKPLPQHRQGIQHNYCLLALVTVNEQGEFGQEKSEQDESEPKKLRDLRVIFPPLMRCLDTAGGAISGTLEVQSGLYVTSKYDKNEKRYITGKLGVGTKEPLARLHIQSPTAILAEEKISTQREKVTGIGETFERLRVGDAIIIRDSSGKIQTRIVTSLSSNSEGKSLEINSPFDSDLKDVNFEYQSASDRTLDIVRVVDRDRTTQLIVNAEGKVGIGTSEPTNRLDVAGGVAIGQAYAGKTKAPDNGLLVDGTVIIGSPLPSDTTNFKLYVNGDIKGNSITASSGVFRSSEGANNLTFKTGDTTRISVEKISGNVGIGIDPDSDAKLNIEGSLKLTNNQQTATVNFTKDNWLQFTSTKLTGYSFDQPLKAQQGIVTNHIENYNNQSLILRTNNQQRIAIAHDTGNVGIGIVPDANAKLNIEGSLKLTNNQQAATVNFTSNNWLQFTANKLTGYSFDQPLKAQQGIVTNRIENDSNQNLILQTNKQQRIAIAHDTGNVGIGLQPDGDAKLNIGGSLKLTNNQQSATVNFTKDNWLQFAATKLTGYSFDQTLKAQQGVITNHIENDNNQRLILRTNNQERIAIAHDTDHVQITGHVGIGLNPDGDAKLNIGGSLKLTNNQQTATISFTKDDWLQFSSTELTGYSFDRELKAQQGVVTNHIQNYDNQSLILRTNSQDRIAIDPETGNVGIGVDSDEDAKLNLGGVLKLTNNDNDQKAAVSFQINRTNSDNWLQFTATNLKGYSFDGAMQIGYNEFNQTAILAVKEKVGIGTQNPAQKLHINGGILRISQEENAKQYLEIGQQNSSQCEFNTTYSQYYFNKPIIINDRLEIKTAEQRLATIFYENGSVKIGGDIPLNNAQDNFKLYVNGQLYTKKIDVNDIKSETVKSLKVQSNGFYQISSRVLKENINSLSSQEVAAILSSLNPVKFIYAEDESKTPHAGFIAEDTPDLLTANDKQAIKVVDIVAVLTKVVQDNRKTLGDLVKLVKRQQAEIANLTQKIKILEEKTDQ